jgi:photosystem II stability/assembly factor-like uncharacterized protein
MANMASECGNLTILSAVPGSDRIMAGVALKGLWANNSGSTWTHLGEGAGSDTISNRPSWIVYDPTNSAMFWESGIYGNGGGVYRTTDGGNTFLRLGSVFHDDFVSVDFSDPARKLLLAGGHEMSQTVWRSLDGGQNWTNIGTTLPANTQHSTNPLTVNAQTYVVNSSGGGAQGSTVGVYRTTNGGTSWQQVSTQGPSGPPLVTATGTIYWPLYFGSLLKSTDSGVTWTQVGSNLQAVPPIQLPDGTLVAVGQTNLMRSADGGATWAAIGAALPYAPASLIYSPSRQAFFISHWNCGPVVLPDAVMKLDYGVAAAGPPAPTNLRIVN